MDSSSSSEDEKLSEAISPELLQFMNKKTQQKQEKKVENIKKPPSIREKIKNEKLSEDSCKYEVKTTKEVQKHVGAKLERYLDSIIETYNTASAVSNGASKDNDTSGIKLLKDSSCVLLSEDMTPKVTKRPPQKLKKTSIKPKKKRKPTAKEDCSSSSSDEEDLTGIAVSGVDIIRSASLNS